jgi:hypothetical protein
MFYLKPMKNLRRSLSPCLFILTLGCVCLGAGPVSAQVLDPITGVSATSADTVAPSDGPEDSATSASLQAGASGILGASDSLSDSGLNDDAMTRFGDWLTTPGGSITYNLGGTYNVSDLLIWNYNQRAFTNAGAQSVEILSSATGTVGSFTLDGVYTFTQANDAPYGSPAEDAPTGPSPQTNDGYVDAAQILPVDITGAHYVELVLDTNYGFTGGLVGLNDVNFVGDAIPEPSTWAMLGLGLMGLAVWQVRRRGVSGTI